MKIIKENILRWKKTHFNNIFREKLDNDENLKTLNNECNASSMDRKELT